MPCYPGLGGSIETFGLAAGAWAIQIVRSGSPRSQAALIRRRRRGAAEGRRKIRRTDRIFPAV